MACDHTGVRPASTSAFEDAETDFQRRWDSRYDHLSQRERAAVDAVNEAREILSVLEHMLRVPSFVGARKREEHWADYYARLSLLMVDLRKLPERGDRP